MLAGICAFAASTNALSFHCNFKMISWVVAGRDVYFCSSSALTIDGNSTHIQSVTGNYSSGYTNADVEGFSVYHDKLSRLPKGIEKFFPILAGLDWRSGSLTSISSEDLQPFPQLQMILLGSNKLTSLDGDLFVYTPKMRYISFDDNLLQSIGFGLLDDLNKLTNAYFNGNPCISLAAPPQTIQELKVKLLGQCPPSSVDITTARSVTPPISENSSTDNSYCSIGCVDLIETLKKKNFRQNEEVSGLNDQVSRLNEAIVELQKQMREVGSNPCSPCVSVQNY